MPILNWIGKEKVINHHREVPFHTLKKEYTFNADESENMIIHGDNLYALKALLPKYEGRIDCIYIDPPYNTGKEGWVYNDNVNDPQIKKWLGQTVGPEGDDLSRHDKWLCMMYPRLRLLHKILANDGVIMVSIDDNEQSSLRMIMDEIFGYNNFISMLSVENNPKGRKNSSFISVSNEYLLLYAKDKNNCYFIENIPKNAKDLSLDSKGNLVHNSGKRVLVGENEFNKEITDFSSDKHYSVYYSETFDDVITKKEKNLNDEDKDLINRGYKRYISFLGNHFVENTYTEKKFNELVEDDALDFKESKIYEKNFSTTLRLKSMLVNNKYKVYRNGEKVDFVLDFKTTSANKVLKKIFDNKVVFQNPKNKNFLEILFTLLDKKDITVLDSFAGSGTTAHAILELNKLDGQNRKFIEIEMGDYANTITAERAKRVISGYSNVEGLGGDFSYYELGEPIFDSLGSFNSEIKIEDIKKYIFYCETKKEPESFDDDYLGCLNDTGYFLNYDRNKETCLNMSYLRKINKHFSSYVIYSDSCMLSKEQLDKYHIIFKKIPRDIVKY